MNSGGSAPADVGGEPPNGRAKGQRASSQNRMFRGPLKRRSIRPSSRMPTTRQRAGFETGTHSSSPLQGAITRGAPHVPPKMTEKAARQPTTKTRKRGHSERRAPMSAALRPAREKMSARHAEPRCLGPKPRLCGWKKSGPGRMCRSWGPKNLRRRSEIRKGSLALTAQVRSGRDHSEREHVDHRMDPSTLKKDRACSSCPNPVSVAHCRASGKKREALAAAKEGETVRCIARGPSRRQAPHASFAQSPLVPAQPPGPGVRVQSAQPPGPGVRVQSVPHLSQQAGKGAVRPA